jgi:hypothetical protein
MEFNLQDFFDDIVDWQWQTFGEGHNPVPCLMHLKKEVDEAIADPDKIEEYADILILTLAAVDRAGFDLFDLLHAAEKKHAINKQRTWGTPDEHGVVQHVG